MNGKWRHIVSPSRFESKNQNNGRSGKARIIFLLEHLSLVANQATAATKETPIQEIKVVRKARWICHRTRIPVVKRMFNQISNCVNQWL